MSKHTVIIRRLTAGLIIAAAGFPAVAQALPEELNATPAPPPVQRTVVVRAQPGFQWGDAGIGAAGAAVLVGAGALGAGAARRRRALPTAVG
jgi:hypothetical protein